MGNKTSEKLKEKYNNNKHQILFSSKDELIGLYSALVFPSSSKKLQCLQKILDPNQYDEYIEIQDFIKNLSDDHKNICEFYFVEHNRKNQDLFDMIFEYGSLIKSPLKKEKYYWIFLTQITEAMIFLEDKDMHYPILSKKYIVQKEKKNFKLVNPYCFPDFLKEVIQIYMNPQIPMSKKKNYCIIQIKRNIQELGLMTLSIILNCDEVRLGRDILFRDYCLKQVKNDISQSLYDFFLFLFNKQNPPNKFTDVYTWLIENTPKSKTNFISKMFGTKEKKKDFSKVNNSTPVQKKFKIFDSEKEIIVEPKKVNSLTTNTRNGGLSSYYQDELFEDDNDIHQNNNNNNNQFQNNLNFQKKNLNFQKNNLNNYYNNEKELQYIEQNDYQNRFPQNKNNYLTDSQLLYQQNKNQFQNQNQNNHGQYQNNNFQRQNPTKNDRFSHPNRYNNQQQIISPQSQTPQKINPYAKQQQMQHQNQIYQQKLYQQQLEQQQLQQQYILQQKKIEEQKFLEQQKKIEEEKFLEQQKLLEEQKMKIIKENNLPEKESKNKEEETLETNDYEKFKNTHKKIPESKKTEKEKKTPVKNNLFGSHEENIEEEKDNPKIEEKIKSQLKTPDQNETIDYFNPNWISKTQKQPSPPISLETPKTPPIKILQIPLPNTESPILKSANQKFTNANPKSNNITDYLQLKQDNLFQTPQDKEGQFNINLRKTATPMNPGEKRDIVTNKDGRVLKKIIISWCREENCQKKFNVYDDGSREEIAMDEMEVSKYSVSTSRREGEELRGYGGDLQEKKNSFNDSVSLNMSLISKEPHLNFFLDTGEQQNSILLFRRKLVIMANKFKDISNIVKFEDQVKPSVYHVVDEIDVKDLPPNLLFCDEEEIKKKNKENQKLNESKNRKGMLSNPKTIIRSKVKAKN